MVLHALDSAWGGEIFVPKIASYKITDVATAIGPNCEQKVVGIRPGEKIHEEMITSSDSFTTYDLGPYYAILPQNLNFKIDEFIEQLNAKRVPQGFRYNSGENNRWVSVDEIRQLIVEHVDPTFTI
jgi:FlaA1/EpsC-like NDP-sugar epimerase